MADILTMIQQFLCYGSQSCIQEFNQYAYKPMEGIFYAVFFPIVVILLFVYIVSGAVGALKAKGFRILIGIAFFAFIILQGWYYFFIVISKMWFVVLFLLGILWFAIHTFTGREGGGGGGGAHGRTLDGGGIGGRVLGRAWKRVTGQEHALVKAIEADLELLSKMNPQDKEVGDVSSRIYQQLRQLYEYTNVEGQFAGEYHRLLKKYLDIIKKMKVAAPGSLPK
jgi:hypothetical protein